ncbi:MAG TPA: hypothetical protein VGS96_03535 [Thermoanaerobaculia bacterium]|nr:hypothetical protein [Thermoanaerobaculia bacterium]
MRLRGFDVAAPSTLDDATVSQKLWEIVEAMSEIGLYLYGTDHSNDRELYESLVSEILLEGTLLDPDDPYTGKFCDLIGRGSEEQSEFGDRLPAHEPRPFNRGRFLPTMERRLARLANG